MNSINLPIENFNSENRYLHSKDNQIYFDASSGNSKLSIGEIIKLNNLKKCQGSELHILKDYYLKLKVR